MKAIGGYFGLEKGQGSQPHPDALALNTGRNALEYVLRASDIRKVHLPYFICDVVMEPIDKLGLEHAFYHIEGNLEPSSLPESLPSDEAYLYPDYFGLKGEFIGTLEGRYEHLIIDASQSLFSAPIEGASTFYSPRKFFGVPDGAFLYSKNRLKESLPQDVSQDRLDHLVKRIEVSAEEGYKDFIRNEKALSNKAIMKMSQLTKDLLAGIDRESVVAKRKRNFAHLHNELRDRNDVPFDLDRGGIPFTYPFLCDNAQALRKRLKSERIYTAIYWPNVLDWCDPSQIEHALARDIVHLPIDHRYGAVEMDRLLEFI